ncbi:hypothetical protein [Jiangella endophytica]|uniref:hypothetical protein n=1 Tax=Jiangella endophytica TaxID=1623398 RepID=UPI001300A589|nr:hypothetical protein [Jiangella endophytica]
MIRVRIYGSCVDCRALADLLSDLYDVIETTEEEYRPADGNRPAEWVVTIRARGRS